MGSKDSDMERGGVQKDGRSEGRAAGRVYICHLLLLQAKNAQEEQGRRKRGRRRRQEGGTMPPARGASLNRPIFILKLNFKKKKCSKHSLYSPEMLKSMPLSGV